MASIQRLPITTPAWTLEKTTTYSTGSPAASPSAFAEAADVFDARGLDDDTVISSSIGMLYTFDAAARPAAFVGVRVRTTPTYTGTGRSLDLWTYNGTSWTRQLFVSISEDQNDGVATGQSRVFELWLTTPATGVQKVWVTYTSTAVTNAGFCACHLYEERAETTTAPFDVATGRPMAAADDVRPRSGLPAALAGTTFTLAYQLDRTPDPGDDALAAADGAWSVLDLPVVACAQITDDAGRDVLVVGVDHLAGEGGADASGVLLLDWDRYEDEYWWDQKTPIYRRWDVAPIPHLPDNDNTESTARYELTTVKRFRRFECESALAPTDATTRLRVTVTEVNVATSARTQTYRTTKRVQVQIAVQGLQFSVLVEHAANEAWAPLWWKASWDLVGPRLRTLAVVED